MCGRDTVLSDILVVDLSDELQECQHGGQSWEVKMSCYESFANTCYFTEKGRGGLLHFSIFLTFFSCKLRKSNHTENV